MNESEVVTRIGAVIRSTLNLPPSYTITRDTTAPEVDGWDSLNHIVLILKIEDEFDKRLPRQSRFSVQNVGELADIISST